MNGKTALVTGASRGIGRAVALELARQGMNVAAVYASDAQAAQQVVAEAQALGVSAQAFCCDVADPAQVAETVRAVTEQLGPVYALVNNAGITRDRLLLQMKDEDVDRVLDVDLKGALYFIRQCYGGFMRQRAGRIVNLSSVVALHGNAGQANYAAAKAGLIGLTKSVAKELASRGVTCNAIAPGMIDTGMTGALAEKTRQEILEQIPMRRAGTPEEVAKAVAFLVSDSASYITGAVLNVDGGFGM